MTAVRCHGCADCMHGRFPQRITKNDKEQQSQARTRLSGVGNVFCLSLHSINSHDLSKLLKTDLSTKIYTHIAVNHTDVLLLKIGDRDGSQNIVVDVKYLEGVIDEWGL